MTSGAPARHAHVTLQRRGQVLGRGLDRGARAAATDGDHDAGRGRRAPARAPPPPVERDRTPGVGDHRHDPDHVPSGTRSPGRPSPAGDQRHPGELLPRSHGRRQPRSPDASDHRRRPRPPGRPSSYGYRSAGPVDGARGGLRCTAETAGVEPAGRDTVPAREAPGCWRSGRFVDVGPSRAPAGRRRSCTEPVRDARVTAVDTTGCGVSGVDAVFTVTDLEGVVGTMPRYRTGRFAPGPFGPLATRPRALRRRSCALVVASSRSPSRRTRAELVEVQYDPAPRARRRRHHGGTRRPPSSTRSGTT